MNLQLLFFLHIIYSGAVFQTLAYSSLPSSRQLLFPWPKRPTTERKTPDDTIEPDQRILLAEAIRSIDTELSFTALNIAPRIKSEPLNNGQCHHFFPQPR